MWNLVGLNGWRNTEKSVPEDRISKNTGYPFKEFENKPLAKLIQYVTTGANQFWMNGGQDLADSELGEALDKLLDKDTGSPLYWFFYGLFENHDLAMWLLRQSVRTFAGMSFEEFLFMSNSSGSNGKGTWINFLNKLLNCKPDGYFRTLEFSKHFIGTTKSGNNPEVSECEGARACVVNESPADVGTASRTLNVELIKQLACGGDNPMTAMGKYKDPNYFVPQLLLAFFAQDAPIFQNDGGLRSRLSYLFMPFEFVNDPKPGTNQRKLDTSVKTNVDRLVTEFIFWAPRLTSNKDIRIVGFVKVSQV